MKSYSQNRVLWQFTSKSFFEELVTSLEYNNVLSKDTAFASFSIKQKTDTLKYIDIVTRNTETTLYYYNNGKLRSLENNRGIYLVNQYIAFHDNGFIDSIGNFEPYNENFEERQAYTNDTVWLDDDEYVIAERHVYKGFQDKEWYFFDERGKIRMIKIYDKGVLLDVILPKEEEE